MHNESVFICSHCDARLSHDPLGSKHRNHCPKCLWSKHVDLTTPGDRNSYCGGEMKPVALAFKDYKVNPYTKKGSGEVMIVHLCSICSKLSPNRVAGDDNGDQLVNIINESINAETELLDQIQRLAIDVITPKNKDEALVALFGINHQHHN